ncbi:hypothetical protein [Pseudomonas sp. NBRC 111128]|uniref:hypothetical protein n=1 Tax=Pseudomonas sp. NBRC 111128 TaxID=1661043 RepID=UPI000AC6E178|nr:hypothetical protein [Pseudomonas sp. NBRC 111128]
MPTQNQSSNTELSKIVTEALVGMVSGVTGMKPPTDEPLPGFIQAPIDRAVTRISGLLAQPAPQPHPEPIAWMVGTAFWWTKEEAERDAEATGLPIVGLGPMTGADEAERLRDVVKHSDNQIMRQSLRISNQRTQLADRLALLREALEFIDDGVGRSDAEWRLIKKLRAALSPDGAAGASDEPYQGMPGTSFQRLNALANQGE